MKKKLLFLCLILFIAGAANLVTAHHTNALCVKVPKANLRTGPGTNYEIAWKVFKYMPFQKVGVSLQGDWYAVSDVDRDVNWIYKNLLTNSFSCAVVKSEKVNVRTGPGTNHSESQMGPAKKYHSFRVLETKGTWVKVRDEWNNTGWIHRDFLWIP